MQHKAITTNKQSKMKITNHYNIRRQKKNYEKE